MRLEDRVAAVEPTVKQGIRNRVFTFAAIIVVIALLAIALDIFKIKDVTWESLLEDIIIWAGFFAAGICLVVILYNKGKFNAKASTNYINTSAAYTKVVDSVKDSRYLQEYCDLRNDEILESIQRRILKRTTLSYEDFNSTYKKYSKRQLKKLNKFTDIEIKLIVDARKVHIKGFRVNTLLGTEDYNDPTNIGPTERQLTNKHYRTRLVFSIFSAAIMTILGIKDIIDWGWEGIVLIVFKTALTLGSSYLSYFFAYNDVSIRLVNSMLRKTDVLKEYNNWYAQEKVPVISNNEIDNI